MPKGIQGFQKGHRQFSSYRFPKGYISDNAFKKGQKVNLGKHWKISEDGMKNHHKFPIGNQLTTGKHLSEEHKMKIRESNSGEKCYRWISDRTQVKKGDRMFNDPLQKQWSMGVKKRDGWKCKINNEECSRKIVAHHILPWRSHPKERYNTDNGITLCSVHHPRRRCEEDSLSLVFRQLIGQIS